MSNPVILAHNLVRFAKLTPTTENSDHPIENVYNDVRWDFWQGTSQADHEVEIEPGTLVNNMLDNPDFEVNADGWEAYKTGTATATFGRNTTSPITGNGDAKLDVTAWASGNTGFRSIKRMDLIKDRTYHFAVQMKVASGLANVWLAFLDNDGVTDLQAAGIPNVGTTVVGASVTYTPTANQLGVMVGIYTKEVTTLFVDDFDLIEVRPVDRIIFDLGHNLAGTTLFTLAHRPDRQAAWVNKLTNVAITSNLAQTATFTASKDPFWKITITTLMRIPRITGIYLGEQWTLPEKPMGQIDPFGRRADWKDNVSVRGHTARSYRHAINQWQISLHMAGDQRDEMDRLRDDIDTGRYPFWLNWNPTDFPLEWHLYLTDTKDWNVNWDGASLRWAMRVKEIGPPLPSP